MEYLGINTSKEFVVNLYKDGSSCLMMSDNTIGNKYHPPKDEHENFIFKDRLRLVCSTQKTSSVAFVFQSLSTDAYYAMFRSDFVEMVLTKFMDHGIVEGTFTFTKKGPGVGLKLWEN